MLSVLLNCMCMLLPYSCWSLGHYIIFVRFVSLCFILLCDMYERRKYFRNDVMNSNVDEPTETQDDFYSVGSESPDDPDFNGPPNELHPVSAQVEIVKHEDTQPGHLSENEVIVRESVHQENIQQTSVFLEKLNEITVSINTLEELKRKYDTDRKFTAQNCQLIKEEYLGQLTPENLDSLSTILDALHHQAELLGAVQEAALAFERSKGHGQESAELQNPNQLEREYVTRLQEYDSARKYCSSVLASPTSSQWVPDAYGTATRGSQFIKSYREHLDYLQWNRTECAKLTRQIESAKSDYGRCMKEMEEYSRSIAPASD